MDGQTVDRSWKRLYAKLGVEKSVSTHIGSPFQQDDVQRTCWFRLTPAQLERSSICATVKRYIHVNIDEKAKCSQSVPVGIFCLISGEFPRFFIFHASGSQTSHSLPMIFPCKFLIHTESYWRGLTDTEYVKHRKPLKFQHYFEEARIFNIWQKPAL